MKAPEHTGNSRNTLFHTHCGHAPNGHPDFGPHLPAPARLSCQRRQKQKKGGAFPPLSHARHSTIVTISNLARRVPCDLYLLHLSLFLLCRCIQSFFRQKAVLRQAARSLEFRLFRPGLPRSKGSTAHWPTLISPPPFDSTAHVVNV